ncbi:MAG TPA: hypothetical protein VGO67_10425, partial [Verrucomicrobiae bacterium]
MNIFSKSLFTMVVMGLLCSLVEAPAQGTAFTYQGRLDESGSPACGAFDMTFSLYASPSGGPSATFTVTNLGVTVSSGQFATLLDFGPGVFAGQTWWLELGVRTNGSGAFNILLPRLQVFPAPYAIYATTAGEAASTTNFSGSLAGDVTGTQSATVVSSVGGQSAANVASATLAANGAASANTANTLVERDAIGSFAAGMVTATSFTGNGIGLTNIPGSSITGTLDDALLTNVFFLSASNNLPNILVATNPANQFSGTLTGSLNGNAASSTTAASFSGSLAGDVTGTQSATVVSSIGGQSAANVASGVLAANGAASANTANTIILRDATGSFSAGTITATNFTGNGVGLTNIPGSSITGTLANTLLTNVFFLNASNNLTNVVIATNTANQISGTFTGSLNGNATIATTATTATSFSGLLAGDVTGAQSATVISSVGGQSAANVASGALAANGAASANTANTIIVRDSNGSFSAGTVTATNFTGNGVGLTNVPGSSITGTLANTLLTNVFFLNASNNLANVLVATNLANQISGTFTGSLNGNAATATTAITAGSFSGSLAGDVTGAQSATVVSSVGGQSAANVASATLAANGASSANTANTLVERDATGSFAAGTVTATNFTGNGVGLTNIPGSSITGTLANTLLTNVFFLNASNNLTSVVVATNTANQISGTFAGSLNGNATTATTATTAGSFSGSLAGDVIGTQSATVVSSVGGQSAANVASGTLAANGAASANTANTLVERDATGSFSAGTVTATNFTGNGSGLTSIPGSSITGTLDDALLTNVFFLSASNNLVNVIVATNTANQISGTFTGSLNGNAASSTTAGSFSGSLAGDVTGTQSATVVSSVGGQSAANVASATLAANGAASANTANTLVERDATGSFAAGMVTATSFTGNGIGLTNIPGSSITGTLDDALLTNVFFLSASNNLPNILVATNLANQISGSFIGSLNGNAASSTTATSFSGSLAGDVTGTQSATVVSSVGGQSAANVASGALAANGAASANTANTIVERDATGSFSAGTVTATNFTGNGSGLTNIPGSSITGTLANTLLTNVFFLNASNNLTNVVVATNTANQISGTFTGSLNGNATTATTATTATSFSGSLAGDVAGTQGATVVSSVGGQSAANVASGVLAANGAASANTASKIVLRDATGSFAAGTITATNFTGNGVGLTNVPGSSITGTLANTLLTNVFFLSASNNLTNVVVATNAANQLSGTFNGSLNGNAASSTTATSFSGSLAGDVTGTQSATVVSSVGGQSAANVASGALAANGAASANTANTLVERDATGSFAAGTLTATNFTGNGVGLTNIPGSSITGTLANTLLTNVFFLNASNNLANVIVATNTANQISGTFAGSLNGNATTATTATTATSFSGSLAGDVTGTQGATVVS